MRVFSEKQRTTHLLKLYQSERFLKDIEQERAIRNWLGRFSLYRFPFKPGLKPGSGGNEAADNHVFFEAPKII